MLGDAPLVGNWKPDSPGLYILAILMSYYIKFLIDEILGKHKPQQKGKFAVKEVSKPVEKEFKKPIKKKKNSYPEMHFSDISITQLIVPAITGIMVLFIFLPIGSRLVTSLNTTAIPMEGALGNMIGLVPVIIIGTFSLVVLSQLFNW